VFSEEKLLTWLKENNPELKSIDFTAAKEKAAINLAKKDYFPDLTLGVEYINTNPALEPPADPETGVAGYRVFRNGSQIAEIGGTSYEDTGLSPATSYNYRVRAVNGEGLVSSASNQATATTDDATAPTVPPPVSALRSTSTRCRLSQRACVKK